MASDHNIPAKLTEEMRAEITDERFGDDMVKPLNTGSQENVQAEYEETKPVVEPEEDIYIETAKAEEVKRAQAKIRKPKRKRLDSIDSESRSLSRLHGELRKHNAARKKTDLAVKDIERQLKALLLAHHSTIRDLKKQVAQIDRKIATFQAKAPARTTRTTISKKSIKKTGQKKVRREGR